jgi:DNA topoisomerase I
VDLPTAERVAAAAGLVRLAAGTPGIERRRCGRGFTYRAPDGSTLDGSQRARAESLAVPPAWNDVWIAPRPDSHVLASGIDDAGRKQYLYHPAWREAADALKFERLGEFGRSLPRLRRQVATDLRSRDADVAGRAVLVRLIDRTLIRPGSRRYAVENGTFGATTLLASHVEVRGATLHLVFPGKGGAEHDLSLEDRELAGRLRRLLAEADDDTHLVVDDNGQPLERDDVNEYIADLAGPFTVKDFRTWGATCTVVDHLAPSSTADPAAVTDAIAGAAQSLGNTPAVCRASYVAPRVVEAHQEGRLQVEWQRARSSRWMSRAERVTARVLTE